MSLAQPNRAGHLLHASNFDLCVENEAFADAQVQDFSGPLYSVAMSDTLSAALSGITLPDTEGNEVRLGSLWQEAPAVLVFLRHYG